MAGLSRVFVPAGSAPAARLRRRGETLLVDFDDLDGLGVVEQRQGAANLLAAFEELKAADLADVIRELTPKRRIEVASALDDERLADVLEELPEDDQVEILSELATRARGRRPGSDAAGRRRRPALANCRRIRPSTCSA